MSRSSSTEVNFKSGYSAEASTSSSPRSKFVVTPFMKRLCDKSSNQFTLSKLLKSTLYIYRISQQNHTYFLKG
ncbi:hypothetical protein Pfo_016228 [Paulownia fortunei]|nr:hypothetical protein Pfo_016228 [Paulownia fortunei]